MTKNLRQAPHTKRRWYARLWFVTWRTVRGVVLLEDSAERIARGSAAGIFASALPVFGQTFIGMLIARVLRGNVVASLPWSWISNPLTTLPIWYGGYRLGLWLIPGDQPVLTYTDIAQIIERFNHTSWSDGFSAMFSALAGAIGPLWLGTTVMGIVLAIPGYFLIHATVIRWQRRKALRTNER